MPKPPVLFRTADQFRAADAGPAEVLREAESVRARIDYLQRGATDGALTDTEQAEVRGLTKTLDGLLDFVDESTVIDRRGVVPDGGTGWIDSQGRSTPFGGGVEGEYRDGVPLTDKQSF